MLVTNFNMLILIKMFLTLKYKYCIGFPSQKIRRRLDEI